MKRVLAILLCLSFFASIAANVAAMELYEPAEGQQKTEGYLYEKAENEKEKSPAAKKEALNYYWFSPKKEQEQEAENVFPPDENGIYVVDLSEGFWKFFHPGFAPVHGEDNIFYLAFDKPVEGCIGVASRVAAGPGNYLALSKMEWAAGVRDHETNTWCLRPGAYDYANEVGLEYYTTVYFIDSETPRTVDAYVVTTKEDPGEIGYELAYNQGAVFFFRDYAAAIRFAHQVENYCNSFVSSKGNDQKEKENAAPQGDNGYTGKRDSVYNYAFSQFGSDNREEARLLFEIGAKRGDARAQYMLGVCFPDNYSEEEKLEFLNASADQQYAPAIYELALFYENKEKEKAAELFSRAAEMLYHTEETDDALIAYTIAQCWRFHDGPFEEDMEKAVEWYAEASRLGYPAGSFKIGHMIFHGIVEGSDEEVFNRFVEAMNASEPQGYFYCALLVMYGITSGDFDALMQEAADRGSQAAQIFLEKNVLIVS